MGGKGWGVVTLANLTRGEYVACYVGEVLDPQEARVRNESYNRHATCSYIVEVAATKCETAGVHFSTGRLGGGAAFAVDSTSVGNVTRFINHSCMPNLEMKRVFSRGPRCRPHLAFFVKEDVGAGEELTWSYSKGQTSKGATALRCCCGAPSCRGFL